MNIETINQLKTIMQPVAEKIGQGAEYGWDVVVRQQFVYATLGTVSAIAGIILGVTLYNILKKAKDWEYEIWPFFVGVFGGAAVLASVIIGTITAITHFINPSYYAIQFFLGLVR